MAKETTDSFSDKNFGEDSEMKPLTIDWGKEGDFLVGTFIKSRHNVDTQFGKNSIYDILSDRGEYHVLKKKVADQNPTVIGKGEVWSVWGRGDIFNGQMNALRPGQIIKLQYIESKESKMGNDAKIVKIFAPKDNEGKPLMNKEWLASQTDTADKQFDNM